MKYDHVHGEKGAFSVVLEMTAGGITSVEVKL